MSAVWLMAAVAAVWFARRKRKPAWNVMHIRDSHGCYLTVITDRDGSHFAWTSDSARAMVTADPQLAHEYMDILIRIQPENGPFRFEKVFNT